MNNFPTNSLLGHRLASSAKTWLDLPARIHRDDRGSISIASVFALLLLTMLLGMVMNSGQQVDQKVKLQNAADAATYSGGVVLARGMNTLAFTNHLLSDVFALTAFLREAEAQSARSLTPEILANWKRIAPIFSTAEFPKFAALGPAISTKVPHEQEMVATYSEWAAAASELILPVMEDILSERRIPDFQRALVATTPELAQIATAEIARRHGRSWPRSTELKAVLWRTDVDPVGGDSEEQRRTLPVVDPVEDNVAAGQEYFDTAVEQRSRLAHRYLSDWNNEALLAFDWFSKMSQFNNLWRIFTCGQLKYLLEEEYPDTNLPHVIRTPIRKIDNLNLHLEQDFMFVGVVYREKISERIPRVFRNPISSDTQAYTQVSLFIPRRRLIKWWPSDDPPEDIYVHLPGDADGGGAKLPNPNDTEDEQEGEDDDEPEWRYTRQSAGYYPEHWDLINQSWAVQLVPATIHAIPQILSTTPNLEGVSGIQPPDLAGVTADDLHWLSNH